MKKTLSILFVIGLLALLMTAANAAVLEQEDFEDPSWAAVQKFWDFDNVLRDQNVVVEDGYLKMWNPAAPWWWNWAATTVDLPTTQTTTVRFKYTDNVGDNNSFCVVNHDSGAFVGVQSMGCRIYQDSGTMEWRLLVGGINGWEAKDTAVLDGPPTLNETWTLIMEQEGPQLTCTLKDHNDLTTATASGDYSSGYLIDEMPVTVAMANFNGADQNTVWIDSIEVKDQNDAVIFSDDYTTSDPEKLFVDEKILGVWPENRLGEPNSPYLANGGVNLSGLTGSSAFYSRCPTRNNERYDDFDMLMVLQLVDDTAQGGGSNGWFATKIRQQGDETPNYTCAINPTTNQLEIGPGTGYNSFTTAQSASYTPSTGTDIYVFIQAAGGEVRFGVGPNASTVDASVVDSSVALTSEGFFNFANFNLGHVIIKDYTIYEYGTGGFPAPFSSGVADWSLY